MRSLRKLVMSETEVYNNELETLERMRTNIRTYTQALQVTRLTVTALRYLITNRAYSHVGRVIKEMCQMCRKKYPHNANRQMV
jgi:lipoate synthase